jgi:hypothetical protein
MRFISNTLLAALLIVAWLGLIDLSSRLAKSEHRVDCSISEFHPDITPKEREACRERRRNKS